jgi:hypothetical protein
MTEEAMMNFGLLAAALGTGVVAYDTGIKALWVIPIVIFLLIALEAGQ